MTLERGSLQRPNLSFRETQRL